MSRFGSGVMLADAPPAARPSLEDLLPELQAIDPVDLAHLFFRDGEVNEIELDGEGDDGEKKTLVEKVILRTGTWKIRPTPGGPERKALKVFRDKAPKGHISLAELVKNFDAGVVEHVAVPLRHTDDPSQNTGYVRKLRIKDLEDGSAQLIAGIEFTEPDISGKVQRGTIPNVSSGVLFDFLHKETGKRFGQVLDHVCLTRRPWINGMPAFGAALSDEPIETDAEYDFSDDKLVDLQTTEEKWDPSAERFTDEQYERACVLDRGDKVQGRDRYGLAVREPDGTVNLNALKAAVDQVGEVKDAPEGAVKLARARLVAVYRALGQDEPKALKLATDTGGGDGGGSTDDGPSTGDVVWKPEEGSGWVRSQVNRRLREMRSAILRTRIGCDDVIPYYRAEDVSGDKVLITAGYGDEQEAWIANFKVEDGSVVLDNYDEWIPARQEWVAAAQKFNDDQPPAGRASKGTTTGSGAHRARTPSAPPASPLRLAQQAREQRLGHPGRATTGGKAMGLKLSDLLARGVELSDEEKEQLEREEREQAQKETELAELREEKRKSRAKGVLGKLKDLGLEATPGLQKCVRNIVLSDDGGAALEFAEFDDDDKKVSSGAALTATEIVEKIFDAMPRDKGGKLTLSQQAAEDPNDPKPPAEREDDETDKKTPEERATDMEDELDLPWAREREPAGAGAGTGGEGK